MKITFLHVALWLDRIDTNKATDDLLKYLERWNSDMLKSTKATKPADSTHHKTKLCNAIAAILALQKHPRIKWTDLYTRKDYTAPFWETLLYDPIVTGKMSVIYMAPAAGWFINERANIILDVSICGHRLGPPS